MKKLDVCELLKSVTGEGINISYFVVNSIKEYTLDEQIHSIRAFCEMFGTVESEKTFRVDQVISESLYEDLKTQYGQYVNEQIKTVLSKAYLCEWSEDKFYSSLWKSITNGGVLETVEEWAFGLYYVVIDNRIPYFRLNHGLKMDQDRYEGIIEDNIKTVKKLRYALAFPFEEKTEEASIILDEIDSIAEKETRIVLLSVVINHLRRERDRAFEMLKEILDSD